LGFDKRAGDSGSNTTAAGAGTVSSVNVLGSYYQEFFGHTLQAGGTPRSFAMVQKSIAAPNAREMPIEVVHRVNQRMINEFHTGTPFWEPVVS
jgi:hypothetical protein